MEKTVNYNFFRCLLAHFRVFKRTKNYYYRYNLVFKNGYSANIESSSGVNGVEKFLGS